MKMSSDHTDGYQSLDDSNELNSSSEWVRVGMRLAASATLHPFEYAKVLIQLGYEPVAPRPGVSLLGKPTKMLPNIFQYAGYIRSVDGFFGCYRGLIPKLMGSVCSLLGSERIADSLGFTSDEDSNKDSDEDLYISFKMHLKREVVLTASGVIISHPFQVISFRMMSQFIGRETIYRSVISSIIEIHKNDGLSGFFAGLIPKLMCDVACVILTSSTVYLLNKYVIKDKLGRQYSLAFTQYAFASILYPLQVVSTCMTVTRSRLMAGQPPIMPEYKNWLDCWNDLQTRGELKRGSSLFWRSVPVLPKNRINEYAPLPTIAKYN